MSDVLRLLDHRVAEAAQAWLADPRDTAVYARLVAAVAERRATIEARRLRAVDAPALEDDPSDAEDAEDDAADADDTEQAEDAEDAGPPMRPVGADLVGDPRAVLDRLRRP